MNHFLQVGLKYTDDSFVTKTKKEYIIDVSKLVQHIIINNLDSGFLQRTTNYYSDFLGKDSYNYLLEFENDVKIDNSNKFIVRNEFGTYSFSIKQVNSNTVLINSVLIISSDKVEKTNIKDVFDVYSAVNSINNMLIIPYK